MNGSFAGRSVTAVAFSILVLSASPADSRAAEPATPSIALEGLLRPSTPRSITVAELEKLPLTEYTTFNPYDKRRVRYRGVLLRDLAAALALPAADRMVVTAIDAYRAEFTSSEWKRWDIMLATQVDRKHIGVKDSGPARIVFPYDTAPDIDRQLYNPKWVWLIKSLRFEEQR
jgi:hypothetical protein